MLNWFKQFYLTSHLLTNDAFELMCANGSVLEQDARGAKVIQLADGNILKIFRVKRVISGTNIYSYARRFCRNAQRLQALNIETVRIKTLYHFETPPNTAVLYAPLAGVTIRQLLQTNKVTEETAVNLGRFLAILHQKGVHFHSLHAGNIVQTNAGNLGLIDISDLSIYPWPLMCNTRIRSFKRLCRYPDDIKKLGLDFWSQLLVEYSRFSHLGSCCNRKILNLIPF